MYSDCFMVFQSGPLKWEARGSLDIASLLTASVVQKNGREAEVQFYSNKNFKDSLFEKEFGSELLPLQKIILRMFIKICIRIIKDEALEKIRINESIFKSCFPFLQNEFFHQGLLCGVDDAMRDFSCSFSDTQEIYFEKKEKN